MNSMNPGRIYDFEDPNSFLKHQFELRKLKDPSLSVRKWAQQMGLESPVLLADLLNGQKRFKPRHVDFLKKGLTLDPSEELYLCALILKKGLKESEDSAVVDRLMTQISPGRSVATRFIDDEKLFSDWTIMAILSALEIEELRTRSGLICAFESRLTSEQLDARLDFLKSKNLIEEDESGFRPTQQRLWSSSDKANEGARSYYSQVLDLAKSAISMELSVREFQCFSLTLSSEDIVAYKEMIRAFRTKIASRALHTSSRDVVYQVGIQFFPLTAPVLLPIYNSLEDHTQKTLQDEAFQR